jgi:hypothetical protein
LLFTNTCLRNKLGFRLRHCIRRGESMKRDKCLPQLSKVKHETALRPELYR